MIRVVLTWPNACFDAGPMAGAIQMQTWITVRGPAGRTTAQPESAWLDLGPFRDCGLFYEVADTSGSPLLDFQTAPTRDACLMRSVHTGSFTSPPIGVSTLPLLGLGTASTNPLARFLRWSVSSSVAWSITFRAWASPNLASAHDTDVPLRDHEILVQDWTTRFGRLRTPVFAPESDLIDLKDYRDVVMFAEMSDRTATGMFLDYFTSPVKTDLFTSCFSTGTVPVGVVVTPIRYDTATPPVARYLRWQFTNTKSDYSVTFRIWMSAKPCGPKPTAALLRRALGGRASHT